MQGSPFSPANQCSGKDKAGLSRQKDCRDFHRTVWQQPTQQEFGLSCLHVVQPNDAQNDSVVEQHHDSPHTPGHSQRHGENGDLGVVCHQFAREARLRALQGVPLFLFPFFARHSLGGISLEMLKRHEGFFRSSIEQGGQTAESASRQRYNQRQQKFPLVAPEGLRKGARDPNPRPPGLLLVTRLMDLAVGPRHKGFEVEAHGRLVRKSH